MPPLAVRVQVAERQYKSRDLTPGEMERSLEWYKCCCEHKSLSYKLEYLLTVLFGEAKRALDHDPALILRPYNPRIKDVASRYTPHAHDPDALIYREKADHQQKTTGRKPGAERTITTKGSDIGIKTKFARLEKKKTRKKRTTIVSRGFGEPRKMKIPSRPFPTGRKFDGR